MQRKARSTMSSLRLDVLRDGAEKFDTWEIRGRGDQEKRTMLGEILRGRGGMKLKNAFFKRGILDGRERKMLAEFDMQSKTKICSA